MNTCKKEFPSLISIILITDRQHWYVCVGQQLLSSKLPFYLIFGYGRFYGKNEEKGPAFSYFYNIGHSKLNVVRMYRSKSPLFKTAILPIIWLI